MSKHHTLSRTAERIYWLGRYLERAENTARIVNVNANMMFDLPIRLSLGWRPLIEIMSAEEDFEALFDEANEKNVVRFMTSDRRNPGSVLSSLDGARENARTVRELMPRIAFEYINDLYLYAKEGLARSQSRSRTRTTMDGVLARIQQIDGFLSRTMLHGDGWSFMRLGQFLERADMGTRIIDVRSRELFEQHEGIDLELPQWRSILRSLHAMQAYRASVQDPVEEHLVLEFLFKNDTLPRSLAYCLKSMRNSLRSLPRNDKPLAQCNRVLRHLLAADVADFKGEKLHAFIDERQLELGTLHEQIGKTYFYHRPRLRRARKASPGR
jgi:uncharacterized alpha-E superfamily protein